MPLNEPEIIEAEIVENFPQQQPLPQEKVTLQANAHPSWHTPGDHARPYADHGGMLSGFLVLALGFVVTVFVLIFSVCVVIPVTILMRLLGLHKNK